MLLHSIKSKWYSFLVVWQVKSLTNSSMAGWWGKTTISPWARMFRGFLYFSSSQKGMFL